MQQKTTKVLYNYWNDVRDGRLAPRRFDIEPARISEVLPDTFMLERIAKSICSYHHDVRAIRGLIATLIK